MNFRIYRICVSPFAKLIYLFILACMAQPAPAQVTSVLRLLSTPNPVVNGQSTIFTAGVNWTGTAPPTGTIILTDAVVCPGDASPTITVLGTITLGSATSATPGAGTLQVSSFPCVGANSISAAYSGDDNYSPGVSRALLQTVLDQFTISNITLASSPNPSGMGQSVTFTAQLTYSLTNDMHATGTVTFIATNTGSVLGTASAQTSGGGKELITLASITTSTLDPGAYAVQATYSGDSIYASSISPIINQIVQQASPEPSTTTLTVSATEFTVGDSVTLTAQVNSDLGFPDGAVQFLDGTTVLGTLNLDLTGQATLTTSSFTAGAHLLTAAYGGSSAFASSTSGTVNVTVDPVTLATTTTELASSANPATAGIPIAFVATVASSSSDTPTGTVMFQDVSSIPGIVLGIEAVQNGTATLNLPFSVGTYQLSATYSGDSGFAASAGTLTQVVNPAILGSPASTSVNSSANPSTYGQTITFTATVARSSGVPTGNVVFTAGSLSAAATLDNSGTAAFTTSALSAGTVPVSVAYSGDTMYSGSTSPILLQTTIPASTTISLRASRRRSRPGSPVTFTSTLMVNSPGSGTPTGTVSFVVDELNTLCDSATVQPDATATCSTDTLSLGSHIITAHYSGDPNFLTSSECLRHTVIPGHSPPGHDDHFVSGSGHTVDDMLTA